MTTAAGLISGGADFHAPLSPVAEEGPAGEGAFQSHESGEKPLTKSSSHCGRSPPSPDNFCIIRDMLWNSLTSHDLKPISSVSSGRCYPIKGDHFILVIRHRSYVIPVVVHLQGADEPRPRVQR